AGGAAGRDRRADGETAVVVDGAQTASLDRRANGETAAVVADAEAAGLETRLDGDGVLVHGVLLVFLGWGGAALVRLCPQVARPLTSIRRFGRAASTIPPTRLNSRRSRRP